MITGDHAVTAAAIGQELGITGTALTGAEFAAMSDDELKKKLPEIGVVARVAPEDKIRLVTMLQQLDNIVAMTGDGVNDAPALKKADIGVAMGITGTEVSKGAAVMILTDDNFATIVKAVEFGRAIYNNLFNFVRFQMESLVAFIVSYLLAAFFFVLGGTPFTPFVVLWINFLVQIPVALALGFDDPAPDLMEHKPRPLKQPILSSLTMGAHCLHRDPDVDRYDLSGGVYQGTDAAIAATMGFVFFSLMVVVLALSARSETGQRIQPRYHQESTPAYAVWNFAVDDHSADQANFLQSFLGLTEITGNQWLICIAFAFGIAAGGRSDQVLHAQKGPTRTATGRSSSAGACRCRRGIKPFVH